MLSSQGVESTRPHVPCRVPCQDTAFREHEDLRRPSSAGDHPAASGPREPSLGSCRVDSIRHHVPCTTSLSSSVLSSVDTRVGVGSSVLKADGKGRPRVTVGGRCLGVPPVTPDVVQQPDQPQLRTLDDPARQEQGQGQEGPTPEVDEE